MEVRQENIKKIIGHLRDVLAIGDRPFRAKDFHRICRIDQIEVLYINSGVSFILKPADVGSPTTIAISRKAIGRKRTFQMFHELGHYLCNHTKGHAEALQEAEADLFATLTTGFSRRH